MFLHLVRRSLRQGAQPAWPKVALGTSPWCVAETRCRKLATWSGLNVQQLLALVFCKPEAGFSFKSPASHNLWGEEGEGRSTRVMMTVEEACGRSSVTFVKRNHKLLTSPMSPVLPTQNQQKHNLWEWKTRGGRGSLERYRGKMMRKTDSNPRSPGKASI